MTESRRKQPRLYLDLTHLGRHVTGLERISIDLFETAGFQGFEVVPVRSRGTLSMILTQQLWLPLLAALHRDAVFAFPGFPPSPLFVLCRRRVVLYVHDLFLLTRGADLNVRARWYMRPSFRLAVRHLRHFLVNSEKTAAELRAVCHPDAGIDLYRPAVANVFGLTARANDRPRPPGTPLRMVALGTIEPRKNFPAAARIRDALARAGETGAELHIVGRAGWGGDAAALAGMPGVTLHGYVAPAVARTLIESADLYISTSHDEGLGLPLLEVQYAGIPVVAPQAPVFREVLGDSGIFIDAADADAAAARILAHLAGWTAVSPPTDNLARWNALAAADRQRVDTVLAAVAGTRHPVAARKPSEDVRCHAP